MQKGFRITAMTLLNIPKRKIQIWTADFIAVTNYVETAFEKNAKGKKRIGAPKTFLFVHTVLSCNRKGTTIPVDYFERDEQAFKVRLKAGKECSKTIDL